MSEYIGVISGAKLGQIVDSDRYLAWSNHPEPVCDLNCPADPFSRASR